MIMIMIMIMIMLMIHKLLSFSSLSSVIHQREQTSASVIHEW